MKQKPRRPRDTVILADGLAESILKDAVEFLEMEDYYVEAGIPHRRGYLLHGPPGVGKSMTIPICPELLANIGVQLRPFMPLQVN